MDDHTADEQLLSRIEDASINASAPAQQRWLDGWILRYCPGKARRARCVNAVAQGRLPLDQKLALVRALYREADLPLVVRLTRFTQPPDLDMQLQDLGWAVQGLTRVQVLTDLTPIQTRALPLGTRWVSLDSLAYAEAVGMLRESPAAHRRLHAQRLASSPVPHRGYAIVRDGDSAVLACGQTAQEAELVGLYDIHTRHDVRAQGLAGALCERLLTQSMADGATVAYLQVESDNHAALRVYSRLGFRDGYTYHYREAPAA